MILFAGSRWSNDAGDRVLIGFNVNPEETWARIKPYLERAGWDKLDAVKNGQVFAVDHGGLRSIYDYVYVQYIAKSLYPDLFQDIDPVKNLEELYASNFDSKVENKKKIIIDYGGANVAKPLHVGHLRSAIIGEGLKRLARELGHEVIGDVHLGDFGRPLGLVISEIRRRKPDLVYFDENYTKEYPKESPVTIDELNEIYPIPSQKAKENVGMYCRRIEKGFKKIL